MPKERKVFTAFTLSKRQIQQLVTLADYNGLSKSAQVQVLIAAEYRRFLHDRKKEKQKSDQN